MPGYIADRWWIAVLRGVLAVVFGVLAFGWPGMSLLALVLLYGAYAFVDGAMAIGVAFVGRRAGDTVWPLVLAGVLGILLGVVTLFWPGITAVALLALIAAWAILRGILEIVAAIRLRRVIEREWLLALGGLLSIALGVLLVVEPGAGALAVLWIVAAYAIVFGVVMILFGLRLRRSRQGIGVAVV